MLIERERALNALAIAASSARAASGCCVIVSGEAGAGKTSLINAFSAGADGMKICRGSSEALFAPRPLGPLRDMGAGLDRRVADLLEQSASQDAIFPAVLKALDESPRPIALIFEDAHWADNATLDLIKYLGRRIAYVRALVIISLRSDELGLDHPLLQVLGDLPAASTRRISLEPLSVEGIATLTKTSGSEAQEIHRITSGNPFFATELIASETPPFHKAPASVRDAVWARLQRLSPEQRHLLETISIEPAGVESWLADALNGSDSGPLLDSCVERGLLVENEDRFVFRHEIARAATMERLRPSARRELHGHAYETLRSRVGIPLSRLVHHASGAEAVDTVLDLAPRAAKEAIRLGAHREAERHLATALAYVKHAPPAVAAQLLEDWSIEASLALNIHDEIIAAAARSVALWREAGRLERVANGLRWLSRLHWMRGDTETAVRYIEDALKAFDGEQPTREIAMIYSTRAQLYMFNDQFDEAGQWARKAIALAEQLGDVETQIHSLNNLGGSLLFAGNAEGKPYMQKSLDLALEHGFHEHASRAYDNYIEYAVLAKEFELAEHLIGAASAFIARYDLDGGVHIMATQRARLSLERGRLEEAEAVASTVVGLSSIAFIVKYPAQMVLSRARMRLGRDDSQEQLEQVMEDAIENGEQQHIAPARLALIEAAWLAGNMPEARAQVAKFSRLNLAGLDSWDLGAFATWWKRSAMPEPFPEPRRVLAAPRAAEVAGRYEEASDLWLALGSPYEAALALAGSPSGLLRAIGILDEIGAAAAASHVRRLAKDQGLSSRLTGKARGPYRQARQHPLGLTGRQADVFRLLVDGKSNPAIATKLNCSPRTVENHVSAILAKTDSSNRMDLMLRLRNEPWLLP